MKTEKVIEHIVNWLKEYSDKSKTDGFVVGISGGIDSAVTSTLCAMTGKKLIALNMPIRQFKNEFIRSNEHIAWLRAKFSNVETETIELSGTLESLETVLPQNVQDFLTMANTRARLRMATLYCFATHYKLLVAGTGNKVEDFGVGFFTKYGDGGVDISPIADLYKTQVYEIARELEITESIIIARPTDGLFPDGRSDEDQLGATYPELEWAMEYIAGNQTRKLNEREQKVMEIYKCRNELNLHKINPVPVCIIPPELKTK